MNRIFDELLNLNSLKFFKSTQIVVDRKITDFMLKFTLAIFCEIFSLHISYQIDSYFELPSIKKLLVVFVQINWVRDRLAFLKTKG